MPKRELREGPEITEKFLFLPKKLAQKSSVPCRGVWPLASDMGRHDWTSWTEEGDEGRKILEVAGLGGLLPNKGLSEDGL